MRFRYLSASLAGAMNLGRLSALISISLFKAILSRKYEGVSKMRSSIMSTARNWKVNRQDRGFLAAERPSSFACDGRFAFSSAQFLAELATVARPSDFRSL